MSDVILINDMMVTQINTQILILYINIFKIVKLLVS